MELNQESQYIFYLKNKTTQKYPIRNIKNNLFKNDINTLIHLDKNLISTLKNFNTFCHINKVDSDCEDYKQIGEKLKDTFYNLVRKKAKTQRDFIDLKGNIILKTQRSSDNTKYKNLLNNFKKEQDSKNIKQIENILKSKEKNDYIDLFNPDKNDKNNFENINFNIFNRRMNKYYNESKLKIFYNKFKKYLLNNKLKKYIKNKSKVNVDFYKTYNLQLSMLKLLKINKLYSKNELLYNEELKMNKKLLKIEEFNKLYYTKDCILENDIFVFSHKITSLNNKEYFWNFKYNYCYDSNKKFIKFKEEDTKVENNTNIIFTRENNKISLKKLKLDSILSNKKSNNFIKKDLFKINNNLKKTNNNKFINNYIKTNNNYFIELQNFKLLLSRILYKRLLNMKEFFKLIN